MIILVCFFLVHVLIPCRVSISFNFTNIGPSKGEMFTLGGDAYLSVSGIQVTPENKGDKEFYSGRVAYLKQLHLWDKASSELASFSTSFSFVINSYPRPRYADGLTFFLAENNEVYGLNGTMGLPWDTKLNVATNSFVAVEFDTFSLNDWDEPSVTDHVGIDINSLSSVRFSQWLTDVPNGARCQAWIKYDSDSKNLSVSFTNIKNKTVERQDGLYYTIDLRDALPEWVIFGFSAATGELYEKNTIKDWIFNSSELQVDNVHENTDQNSRAPPASNLNTTKSVGNFVGLIIGLSVLVIVVSILAFILWRKNKKYENQLKELQSKVETNNEFEMEAVGPREFSYLELARSTAGFEEKGKLGEGGFGAVYKGFLKDSGTDVAVKRLSKFHKQGFKQYASEIQSIGRLRHRNLVELIGWCHQKSELLLVYKYMENGSLDSHLFEGKSLLTWDTRYKIADGLASALLYLHEEWNKCVLHRDIKSSNVMLDSNFNVKLGDFGLAKLVDHEIGHKTTTLAGTRGYMAPECFVTGKASKETDVFSFGVVAMEIACGRRPIDNTVQEDRIRLLEWVWQLYGTDTLLEAVDPRLGSDFEEEETKRLMIVGLWCVHPDPEHRPSIRQVIQILNLEASLPILPSKMPVASYSTQPMLLLGVSDVDSSKQTTPSSITVSSLYGR